MSEIKVGDLVVKIADCCESHQHGLFGVVTEISPEGLECFECGADIDGLCAFVPAFEDKNNAGWALVSWLKKIEPPKKSQTVATDETITA